MFTKLKSFVLTGKEKAFVSGLVTAVATYVAQNGVTLHDFWSAKNLWSLAAFIIGHQATFWTTNSKVGE